MNPFQNPDVYIGSLRIQEPVTVATDLLVVLAGLYVFFTTKSLKKNRYITLYRYFFLVTALSTLVSAVIGHAFLYQFGFYSKIYGWLLGAASIALAQFASLYHAQQKIKQHHFNLLFWINTIETIITCVLLFAVFKFIVVEIYSAVGLLLIVVPLEWLVYKKTKSPLSKHMLIGIGIAVLSIVCHVLVVAYSEWFNHLDLAHVIMAISVLTMGTGLKKEMALGFVK